MGGYRSSRGAPRAGSTPARGRSARPRQRGGEPAQRVRASRRACALRLGAPGGDDGGQRRTWRVGRPRQLGRRWAPLRGKRLGRHCGEIEGGSGIGVGTQRESSAALAAGWTPHVCWRTLRWQRTQRVAAGRWARGGRTAARKGIGRSRPGRSTRRDRRIWGIRGLMHGAAILRDGGASGQSRYPAGLSPAPPTPRPRPGGGSRVDRGWRARAILTRPLVERWPHAIRGHGEAV